MTTVELGDQIGQPLAILDGQPGSALWSAKVQEISRDTDFTEWEYGELHTLLHEFLQAAIEVEHSTIPPYLMAMYTIKPGTNRAAYQAIRSVVLEEMLHMTLAGNILTAVGGTPRTTYEKFVGYPACVPCRIPPLWVPLRHFSKDAISAFLTIESPDGQEPYWSCAPPDSAKKDKQNRWATIGEFYHIIKNMIKALVAQKGERELFQGPPERQIGPEHFYNSGGEAIKVHNLASALLAMEVIVDEGEGLHSTIFTSDDRIFGEQRQPAHYYRFNEILTGRYYGPYDTPQYPPSGPSLDVDWKAVYPIPVPECADSTIFWPLGDAFPGSDRDEPWRKGMTQGETGKKIDEFNKAYATLLAQIEVSFCCPPVMEYAVVTMLHLKYLAEAIIRNPIPGSPGLHAFPTFAVNPDHFNDAKNTLKSSIDLIDSLTT